MPVLLPFPSAYEYLQSNKLTLRNISVAYQMRAEYREKYLASLIELAKNFLATNDELSVRARNESLVATVIVGEGDIPPDKSVLQTLMRAMYDVLNALELLNLNIIQVGNPEQCSDPMVVEAHKFRTRISHLINTNDMNYTFKISSDEKAEVLKLIKILLKKNAHKRVSTNGISNPRCKFDFDVAAPGDYVSGSLKEPFTLDGIECTTAAGIVLERKGPDTLVVFDDFVERAVEVSIKELIISSDGCFNHGEEDVDRIELVRSLLQSSTNTDEIVRQLQEHYS